MIFPAGGMCLAMTDRNTIITLERILIGPSAAFVRQRQLDLGLAKMAKRRPWLRDELIVGPWTSR
jgi:hypothetical protein